MVKAPEVFRCRYAERLVDVKNDLFSKGIERKLHNTCQKLMLLVLHQSRHLDALSDIGGNRNRISVVC